MALVSSTDDSAALEFDSATGLALNPETSSIGVVLSPSVMTTNHLNKPIPVSSGYAGLKIITFGALGGGIGQVEMSYFHGLEPSVHIMSRTVVHDSDTPSKPCRAPLQKSLIYDLSKLILFLLV